MEDEPIVLKKAEQVKPEYIRIDNRVQWEIESKDREEIPGEIHVRWKIENEVEIGIVGWIDH